MTFKDIAIKNFKGNIKKYLIYYLCNSFIVAMFFMYSVLIFNEKLWTTSQIEKGVLQGLMIPSVALGVFSLFFISYAHSTFIKCRKKEFGVFMHLGMTNGDIRKIIIYESMIVGLGSILLGLLVGVVFSRLFFIIILKLLEVKGISYIIGFNNFIFSIIIFSGIYLANIVTTIIATSRFEVIKLLKADRVIQSSRFSNPIFALLGLAIVIGSFIDLYKEFNNLGIGRVLLETTIIILIGLYLFISQLGGFLIKCFKRHRGIYFKKLLLITSLNSKFKQTKKIIFIISILVTVIIFYTGFMLNLCITAEKEALYTNPYDIFYAEIKDKNVISNEVIEEIVNRNKEEITKHKTLEFVYYYGTSQQQPAGEIIITDKEINKLKKTNLKVSKGNYVFLKQSDGISEDEKKDFKSFDMKLVFNSGTYELDNQENVFKRIFNSINYSYSEVKVVNESDYNFIKQQKGGYELGKIQLYNLGKWKDTKAIVDELKVKLDTINKTTGASNLPFNIYEDMLKVTSKIGYYNANMQGAKLLLFTSGFLGIFFFIATAIVLFLKLLSDIDKDKKRFNSMYKIGITEQEIRKQIASELKPLFFIGPIIGIILAFAYTIIFNQDSVYNARKYFIYSNITVSLVFLLIQLVYYFMCKKIYCDEILDGL
ncbi:FtsX-like permease family protein [Clostridium lacusfryxellense]|uniref:FtsX-like permease family protein n=1 Tax=Clostridium lacusfryxellense TaxID=205328 RepID=UPI001C0D179A|nr:FtsX-like permease family protein [Clostridium lacusfryxellense]MBU3110838.1 FtsX-like permease family protein [Clostridium lacusfryxellense]